MLPACVPCVHHHIILIRGILLPILTKDIVQLCVVPILFRGIFHSLTKDIVWPVLDVLFLHGCDAHNGGGGRTALWLHR